MSIIAVTLQYGHMLQIGESPEAGAVIKAEPLSGRRLQLTVATSLTPIRRLGPGIIPERFATGIIPEPARILESHSPARAVA